MGGLAACRSWLPHELSPDTHVPARRVVADGCSFQALKPFAFNFQHTGFYLHHRSWSQTELMSITSNSYG